MRRAILPVLVIGLIGGAALAATEATTTRGPFILIPGILIAIACAWFLRSAHIARFLDRFWIAFSAITLAMFVLYAFITFVDSPIALSISGTGHALRLLFVLGTSALAGVIVARASRTAAT